MSFIQYISFEETLDVYGKTIEKSGNGKLDNSAIIVTSFQDLMLSVERFSIVFVPGLDFKEKVLPDGSWLYIFKGTS